MIIGITAEWNPFHIGHAYMIRTLRELYGPVPLIAVMSGSFVQRGEPALFDKWSRAEWALRCGVDLVVELPALHVIQSADLFAESAVHLLTELGCSHIAFGTESLETTAMQDAVNYAMTFAFTKKFQEALQHNIPYARAVTTALSDYSPYLAQELSRPNNLLGFRYMLSVANRNLPLTPITVHRASLDSVSSSLLRKSLLEGTSSNLLPENISDLVMSKMEQGAYASPDRYEDACLLSGRQLSLAQLAGSRLFSEGLEHAWKKASCADSYESMLNTVKSKRYLHSRLKRIGASLLIAGGRSPSPFYRPTLPSYIRLLALRKKQSHLLRHVKLQVVTKSADAKYILTAQSLSSFSFDAIATDMQAYCMQNPMYRKGHCDFRRSPVILE